MVNVLALLFAGVVGAVLLHLAAYHIRLDATGAYLLAHCPWRPVLLVVLAVVLVNMILFWREFGRLAQERDRLSSAFVRRLSAPRTPRRVTRLLALFVALYAIGLGATALAMRIAPMQAPMIMDDHTMIMGVAPTFPLALGEVIVAALLALLLWCCERRLTVLRRVLALLRALLPAPPLRMLPLALMGASAPRLLCGVSLFARPPPLDH
jgi:hypothetical protein